MTNTNTSKIRLAGYEEEIVINDSIDVVAMETVINKVAFLTIGGNVINRNLVTYVVPGHVENPNVIVKVANTDVDIPLFIENFSAEEVAQKLNSAVAFVAFGGALFNKNFIQNINAIRPA